MKDILKKLLVFGISFCLTSVGGNCEDFISRQEYSDEGVPGTSSLLDCYPNSKFEEICYTLKGPNGVTKVGIDIVVPANGDWFDVDKLVKGVVTDVVKTKSDSKSKGVVIVNFYVEKDYSLLEEGATLLYNVLGDFVNVETLKNVEGVGIEIEGLWSDISRICASFGFQKFLEIYKNPGIGAIYSCRWVLTKNDKGNFISVDPELKTELKELEIKVL